MEFVAINSKPAGLIDDRGSFYFGEGSFCGLLYPTSLLPSRAKPIHGHLNAIYNDLCDPMTPMRFLSLTSFAPFQCAVEVRG
jgi:hypothetical protein